MRLPLAKLAFVVSFAVVGCRAHAPEAAAEAVEASPVEGALSDPRVVDALLRDSARDDDADTVRSLVRRKIQVDRDLGGGRTALTLAAYHRSSAVVDALLEGGASAKPLTDGDMGPLTHAAFSGDPEIVGKLVRAGADPNEKNRLGQTPLMFAALFGRDEAYAALVRAGAREDTKDRLGRSALSLRHYRGDAKAAEAFLRAASQEVATFAASTLGIPTTSVRTSPVRPL